MGAFNYENLPYDIPVNMEDIQTGMILAVDVVNSDGLILMAKDAVINHSNIDRLKQSRAKQIFIKSKIPRVTFVRNYVKNYVSIPIEDTPEFKEFSKIYSIKNAELKKYILAIGEGAEIKLDELYKLTDGIMSKLTCKSNILTFLAYIRDTDEHTYTHSNNVALLCNLFSKWLNFKEKDSLHLTTAGILHDVGKTKIPLNILNKKGSLTDNEFQTMKLHTVLGYKILENHDIPESIKLAALMHHEKINGLGYPMGLRDNKIDSLAKIVSICDIYDAMTADRIYRPKLCPFEVIRTFERSVYGELDTQYLLAFLQNIAYSYIDSPIKLSDNRIGRVAFINNNNLSKPIVQLDSGEIINLSEEADLLIASLN